MSLPTFTIPGHRFFTRPAIEIFHECGLCASKNEARRLAKQDGLRIWDTKIAADLMLMPEIARVHPDDPVCGFYSTVFLFWRGKKQVKRIIVDCGDLDDPQAYSFGIACFTDVSQHFDGQRCSYGCCTWRRFGEHSWKRTHEESDE